MSFICRKFVLHLFVVYRPLQEHSWMNYQQKYLNFSETEEAGKGDWWFAERVFFLQQKGELNQ